MNDALLNFDKPFRNAQTMLFGVDEVGRGSWVGPVIAAAVHLPDSLIHHEPHWLFQLNDSKKIKTSLRERLASEILTHAMVGFGNATVHEIEALNIHHASLLASCRAVQALGQLFRVSTGSIHVLIDGKFEIPHLPYLQKAVIKGDAQSASIAAASIVAKVYRDDILTQLHEHFPMYQWCQNKGYGTRTHRKAIESYGATNWHRKQFLKKQFSMVAKKSQDKDYNSVIN